MNNGVTVRWQVESRNEHGVPPLRFRRRPSIMWLGLGIVGAVLYSMWRLM